MSGFLGTGSVSLLIGQPLAHDTSNRLDRAFGVGHFKRLPLIVPEIELRKVTLQVLLAHMVIRAGNPALEGGEIAFNRYCSAQESVRTR